MTQWTPGPICLAGRLALLECPGNEGEKESINERSISIVAAQPAQPPAWLTCRGPLLACLQSSAYYEIDLPAQELGTRTL